MKNNKLPAVSVVMGVYNAEKYVDQAIESVLNQTYADFELLLLNDGSTDNSLAHLEHYAKLDSRCKVYSGENQGMVAMANKGVSLAQADIIFRMDNDDVCRPERLEKQVRYLNEHPECVAVGSKVLLIDPDGLPIMEVGGNALHQEIDDANLSGGGSYLCHPAVAFRKEAILNVGGYRQEFHYAEDLDIFLSLAVVGKLANIPLVLIDYRQHFGSAGYAGAQKQIEACSLAVAEAKKRRGLDDTPNLDAINNAFPAVKSISDIHLKWAWWAFMANNRITAKKYAFKVFFKSPFRLQLAKLFYCLYFK